MLEATFQLSWQQVRDERARRFFLLASLFPEAIPIPLWLVGLAAGLGRRAQVFNPLWGINLSLQELSLLEGLADDQVRLHPLVRAFSPTDAPTGKRTGTSPTSGGGITADRCLQRSDPAGPGEDGAPAIAIAWNNCGQRVDYALFLDEPCADQLSHLERWLNRESYLLADERWWPKKSGLFYQQFFNQGVETGAPLSSQKWPPRWLKQAQAVGPRIQPCCASLQVTLTR